MGRTLETPQKENIMDEIDGNGYASTPFDNQEFSSVSDAGKVQFDEHLFEVPNMNQQHKMFDPSKDQLSNGGNPNPNDAPNPKPNNNDELGLHDIGFTGGNADGKVKLSDFGDPADFANMYVESMDFVVSMACGFLSGTDSELHEAKQSKKDRYEKICTKFFNGLEMKIKKVHIFAFATLVFAAPQFASAFRMRQDEAKKAKGKRKEKRENEENVSTERQQIEMLKAQIENLTAQMQSNQYYGNGTQPAPAPEQPKAIQTDAYYARTKEAKSNRRFFDVDENGFYKYDPSAKPRKFIKAKDRKEKPSTRIGSLIIEGYSNAEIKKVISDSKKLI